MARKSKKSTPAAEILSGGINSGADRIAQERAEELLKELAEDPKTPVEAFEESTAQALHLNVELVDHCYPALPTLEEYETALQIKKLYEIGSPAARTRHNRNGHCKQVWEIADELRGNPRKVVLARCAELGINQHTATTQYQAWRKAHIEAGEFV